jgi:hypothetical protein
MPGQRRSSERGQPAAVGPIQAVPTQPDSALLAALKNGAPKLLEYYREETRASRPEIQARIDSGELVPIDLVRGALMASLPPNLLVAGALKPEMEKAVNRLAVELIRDSGGPVDAVIGLGQSEVEDFIRRIRG